MNAIFSVINTISNIMKSLFVLSLILGAFVGSFQLIRDCFSLSKAQALRPLMLLMTVIVCVLTIVFAIRTANYAYPFERSVKFEKIATIDIPSENALNPEYPPFWHAAYEQYGSSFYFSVEKSHSYIGDKGFQWPEMDFKNHTYIITYCQELESLSYNVWETIDITGVHTGAKAGYAVLSEEIDPCKVYVYEIPKMRIDNDRNLTTEFVRQKMREAGEFPFD